MKIGKQKISSTAVILLASMLILTTVLGAVLYTLTVPMQFRVSLAMGLELWNSDKTAIVTSITWSDFSRLETKTQTFYIKNVGNKDANVTLVLGSYDTSAWSITHTFADQLIPKDEFSSTFTVSIEEINAISDGYYGCDLSFEIVSGFSAGSSSFSTTKVNYVSDSAQYFGFVSDNFNASSYPVGSTVLYSFATKNINQTYEIQGLTYKIEILDASNNVVNTVCEGLNVAYYQDATHYMHSEGSGYQGNGIHMTDVPLVPNAIMTIWQSFVAPSTPGVYHLRLTYQSHNVQPVSISWTTEINNPYGQVLVTEFTIVGATGPGIPGTVTMTFRSNVSPPANVSFDFNVTVVETGQQIENQTGFLASVGGNTDVVSFTPIGSGSLTMLLTITSATHP
jgi:hypothetical protein